MSMTPEQMEDDWQVILSGQPTNRLSEVLRRAMADYLIARGVSPDFARWACSLTDERPVEEFVYAHVSEEKVDFTHYRHDRRTMSCNLPNCPFLHR